MQSGLTDLWGQVYVNGALLDAGEAAVSALDRGFLYGDGVYETLRVYDGKPFALDSHLRRLSEGCGVIGLCAPDADEMREGVGMVLEANGLRNAYLRITVTRGATGRLWYDLSQSKPTVIIFTKPYSHPDFGQGMRLALSRFRSDERSPLTGIKQIGILSKATARVEAMRTGADDALLLDTRGFVSEATSSNIFWVNGKRLFTPSLTCGILAGITRETVIRLAREDGIEVVEGEFSLNELRTAEEMFLTSSTWELAPVRSFNDIEFESPGPITRRLSDLYREKLASR